MDTRELARRNLEALKANPYPGRGIIVGIEESGGAIALVYWIMGRSANSRNRVFAHEPRDGRLWTEAADPEKMTDPARIIYNAMREMKGRYIVSNGDQTDTIAQALSAGADFRQALRTRAYEPDAPNYTPRIAALVSLCDGVPAAELAILKKSPLGPGCDRQFFDLEQFAPGFGHCLTTYCGDGDPLPAFQGEPYLLSLKGDAEALGRRLWKALNAENRVALAVKFIDVANGASHIAVVNRY